MPRCESEPAAPPSPQQAMSSCPDCNAELAVLRIIPGRGAEYWTMRCTRCGGIHLYIVKATSQTAGSVGAADTC